MVPVAEIADAKNDYNLNIPHIDSSEPEDIQDLHAHLQGRYPKPRCSMRCGLLGCVPDFALRLVQGIRDGYSELAVAKADIQATIAESDEYKAFANGTVEAVAGWWSKHHGQLERIRTRLSPPISSAICPKNF